MSTGHHLPLICPLIFALMQLRYSKLMDELSKPTFVEVGILHNQILVFSHDIQLVCIHQTADETFSSE